MHQVVYRASSSGKIRIQDLGSLFMQNPYGFREDELAAFPADQRHLQGRTSDLNVHFRRYKGIKSVGAGAGTGTAIIHGGIQ